MTISFTEQMIHYVIYLMLSMQGAYGNLKLVFVKKHCIGAQPGVLESSQWCGSSWSSLDYMLDGVMNCGLYAALHSVC